MIKFFVVSPRKPDFLIRSKLENTQNIKDNLWCTYCRKKDENWVRVHMQDVGIEIVEERQEQLAS